MRKILVVDTSILCVWLQVPGKDDCGCGGNRWDFNRVEEKIAQEKAAGALFVLPLASIIETGNHIAQATHSRWECACAFARLISDSADERSPWAAFTDQSELWTPERLNTLAESWPNLAAQCVSLGDATIKDVAERYAEMGYQVEILTGDQELKAYEPLVPTEVPRRRRPK